MIRTYCDICKAELKRNFVKAPLEGQDSHTSMSYVNVKVFASLGGSSSTAGKGDICLNCLMESLMKIAFKHGWRTEEPAPESEPSATTAEAA